jgi:hypothetical protein
MKALAALVMRGRTPAIAVATVLAALSWIFPPLGLLSAAAVALVTLRQGAREGVVTMAGGLLALAGLGWLIFGQPAILPLVGLVMWLPVWALGLVLRSTRSLALALQIGLLVAAGLVLGQYLLGDPVAFWSQLLGELLARQADPAVMGEAERQQLVDAMAPWMVGGVAASWFLQQAIVLFLARYWQAALYNPGGFRSEFHALRLGRGVLLAMPLLLVAAWAQGEKASFSAQLVLVLEAALLLQGVALVHGLVGRLRAGIGWLIGFFSLLVVAFPYTVTLVTLAGYVDGWLDFRAKVRSRSATDGAGNNPRGE